MRDKIVEFIASADIVIADCTGNNPNVLYELGLAHALGKETILITQDSMDGVPSDIKLFEFIKYDLGRHKDFIAKIDAAISDLLVGRYDRLYAAAKALFVEFRDQTEPALEPVSRDEFVAAIRRVETSEGLPAPDDRADFAEAVLPSIVRAPDRNAIMTAISAWLSHTYP